MRRLFPLIVFVVFVWGTLPFMGQENHKEFIDGNEWGSLSAPVKLGYLRGFEEGLKIAETAVLLEKRDACEDRVDTALLDRIEKWISAYKVGADYLERKVERTDDLFREDENKVLMAAAVLPLVSRLVRGEIGEDELKERLAKLREVLK
ncbi:MAG: hypothetical protein JXB23_07260 [Candidatus Aminicenantes bacterium]|nr:hypothetical protein [Candidatus Aminicenantes bacterium]